MANLSQNQNCLPPVDLAILCNFAVLNRQPIPVHTQGLSPSHITQGNASLFAIQFFFSSELAKFYLCSLSLLPLTLSLYLFLCLSFRAYLLDCFHFPDLFPRPVSFQLLVSESLSICVCLSSYLLRNMRGR